MNIGIVTLPLIDNYGCILQNFALQQILHQQGHTAITFDIRGRQLYRRILTLLKQIVLHPLRSSSYNLPAKFYPRSPEINEFIKNNINVTDPLLSYSGKLCIENKINFVIAGSDQIWRPGYSLFPKDMYLKFVPKGIPRLSYAASFGTDNITLPYTRCREYSNLLHSFVSVSVRENVGTEICKGLFNIEATQVLDPTLLLPVTDYMKLCEDKKNKTAKYIGTYILDENNTKSSVITKISNLTHLEKKEISLHSQVSPSRWLTFFRYADFIVTDSFHGMVFSIIFNKQFLVLDNKQRGSSRFTSLLSLLGLQDRLVDADIVCSTSFNLTEIDYMYVNKRLEELRQMSLEFLTNSLSS